MIDYFKELFTQPQYKWSFVDGLAMFGLIMAVLIIAIIVFTYCYFILDLIKKRKYKTCKQMYRGNPCWHHKDCLRCCEYKKVEKVGGKDDI